MAEIRDHAGRPVVTNAPRRDTECIEVVFGFPSLIEGFEKWLSGRGLHLFPIPVGGDDLPTYGVGIIDPHPTHPAEQPERDA